MNVLIVITAYLSGVVSLTVDDLYPYPYDNVSTPDDQLLLPNYEKSPAIQISFPYFNINRTTAYVFTNGGIGSLTSDMTIYAFTTTIDTSQVGEVWYKLSSNSDLLTRAGSDVQLAFSDQNNFSPSMVFIVTWNEVPYSGASGNDLLLRNTFQLVLTTDGTKSFVMFHYLRLDWARGHRLVGFYFRGSYNFYESRTDDVLKLVNRSNVGVPGRFLFRVDGISIQPADQHIVGFGRAVNSYFFDESYNDDVLNLVNRSNVGVPGRFLFRVDGISIQPADQDIISNNAWMTMVKVNDEYEFRGRKRQVSINDSIPDQLNNRRHMQEHDGRITVS